MNAIIPINIAALRVNANDANSVTTGFVGPMVQFDKMPWMSPSVQQEGNAGTKSYSSIEDTFRGLTVGAAQLDTGIHLHWELPNYFRKGRQDNSGGVIKFPQAPNRWLVVRHFKLFNESTQKYGSVHTKAWIVESDYISDTPNYKEKRSRIPVPLPAKPAYEEQPYKYMGRVVNLEQWDPTNTVSAKYLSDYKDENDKPYYLNALGFVGPHFSAYYPECASVFGFWDRFDDLTQVEGVNVYEAMQNRKPLKFKATYQLVGWINETDKDPFASGDIAKAVKAQYQSLVTSHQKEQVALKKTPADVLTDHLQQSYQWTFHKADIPQPDKIDKLEIPTRCLCNGIIQEICWDMLKDPQNAHFQNDKTTEEVKVAVGNTTTEALAALIKSDIAPDKASDDLLANVEFLLDALQSGWLNRLEHNNGLFKLKELLHGQSFSKHYGGMLWTIKPKKKDLPTDGITKDYKRAAQEMALPDDLALLLNQLNKAQKKYDQERAYFETLARQTFMDWVQKMKASESPDWSEGDLENQFLTFLSTEINSVSQMQKKLGLLLVLDGSAPGESSPKISEPTEKNSLAHQAWELHQQLLGTLKNYPNLQVHYVPAPGFQMPNDPVLVLEGAKIEPHARNGLQRLLSCRMSNELINRLDIQFGGQSITATGEGLAGLTFSNLPTGIQELVQEAFLLVPMLSDALQAKLAGQNAEGIVGELKKILGGASPGETTGSNDGLYEAVRGKKYTDNPSPNYQQTLGTNTYTFTNSENRGWLPDPIGWSVLPTPADSRGDNFLPLFLNWTVNFDPLLWKDRATFQYDEKNLTDYFSLNQDHLDYGLKPGSNSFTAGNAVPYSGSIPLSRNVTKGLEVQIQNYLEQHLNDAAKIPLEGVVSKLTSKKVLAQSLSGLMLQLVQIEKRIKLKVQNLLDPESDQITAYLNQTIAQSDQDNWYAFNFNNQQPIIGGSRASDNFSPLRAGLLSISSLKIVDVFGQEMTLHSAGQQVLESSSTIAAASLQSSEVAANGKIFLPPRLNMPARLWFRWLLATHNDTTASATPDFVEMNAHPSTSPVFGWVLPDHLDNSLAFYAAAGTPIGSMGLENGQLAYRTTPGNTKNTADDLATDIGAKDHPIINPHLARFMWYIYEQQQSANFFGGLMESIEKSNQHISPARIKENTDLAVLIGRPLALTRASIALESKGGTTPIMQASAPFEQDMQNNSDYNTREQQRNGNIKAVQFPVQLGNLGATNDSLIGFLIDTDSGYLNQTFYTATVSGSKIATIQHPDFDTLQLQLNAAPQTLTMLMDPRGSIHATTGILPTEALEIPSEHYATAIQNLAMTFFTHPVIQPASVLSIPHPLESEYDWSWIRINEDATVKEQLLTAQKTEDGPAANQPVSAQAFFAYSPQRIQEGWLKLIKKRPRKPNKKD